MMIEYVDVPDQKLIESFRQAVSEVRSHWAPYSRYSVLAAVQSVDGRIYASSNVETANYTLTKHAEEAAVMVALQDGVLDRLGRAFIKTLYVAHADLTGPCGGCRQFVHEFSTPDCLWIGDLCRKDTMSGEGAERPDPRPVFLDQTVAAPLSELLPLAFGPEHLGIG